MMRALLIDLYGDIDKMIDRYGLEYVYRKEGKRLERNGYVDGLYFEEGIYKFYDDEAWVGLFVDEDRIKKFEKIVIDTNVTDIEVHVTDEFGGNVLGTGRVIDISSLEGVSLDITIILTKGKEDDYLKAVEVRGIF